MDRNMTISYQESQVIRDGIVGIMSKETNMKSKSFPDIFLGNNDSKMQNGKEYIIYEKGCETVKSIKFLNYVFFWNFSYFDQNIPEAIPGFSIIFWTGVNAASPVDLHESKPCNQSL